MSKNKFYHETYRPQFHFTAEKDWLNDPNELVYYKGEYHPFFQHTPGSLRHGNIDGIIALGGGQGTALGTKAMRNLPLGVPKVMVSTLASSDVSSYVGTKDITMMHSVVGLINSAPFTLKICC